ncbi:transcriptional regulator (plasmid) [Azospirillum sp. B510]|uniref:FGGY-family carbohydrate kinase n=1 Tax=Azospirillum sp. (strain B510) TaxID=137722 RepID=UPI0001C4C9E0|nr:FGGY-family carbohydrate kinase [Azospirillum sp. B510]BAI75251.1 transcriptional regulator [Azospirillum sp. B510]
MTRAVIGVDVGTGSARAGIFDLAGHRLAAASRPIRMWKPDPEWAEQSSDDIWAAVCAAVREALAACAETPEVVGIGFDATCSLVVLDAAGRPVTVDPEGDDSRNVIVWMDHRAIDQTGRINAGGHEVLRYVGGRLSPEMQTPKLLWLKETLPRSWSRAAHFLDLPDFLTWRATGSARRSLCSLVCKWTYLGHEGRWDDGYLRAIGLGDLVVEGHVRIGTEVGAVGSAIAGGLSTEAARELGLTPGIAVGTSMIDAHAGGIGVIGATVSAGEPIDFDRRLALIGGTSSCHMVMSPAAAPRFIPGVWGPYHSAMLPGLWLNEGGQSATGALIDHVVRSHPRHAELVTEARRHDTTIYQLLNEELARLAERSGVPMALLTRELHVLPDFHGNRSPRADASLRGAISGLRLSDGLEDLALLYLATVQAVAYGTRHIVAAMNGRGYAIDTILACGGGTRNPVFLKAHADATGCTLVLPEEPQAVLLGAAMLGAVAGGAFPDIAAVMAGMSRAGRRIEPAGGALRAYHDAKYAVFLRLHEDQMAYRGLMEQAG